MKIVTVIGARPQFVKAAVVSLAFGKYRNIKEIIVHTGQHYDDNMSKIFFDEMNIPAPKYNLNVGSHSHGKQTGTMLGLIEEILQSEQPDAVLVYGDTNSTLAAGIAAVKIHIPVIHIEAGLRSYNKKMPEEINRVLVDHLSTLLFPPSKSALKNLMLENIDGRSIFVSGDVMIDAALTFSETFKATADIYETSETPTPMVLCTIHRPENTDNPVKLLNILELLELISIDSKVIFPLHPRTKGRILELNTELDKNSNIDFVSPVGYLDMLKLETQCQYVVTDSGGIQKEAYALGKPCITIRDETEWTETVDLGYNLLLPLTQEPRKLKEVIDKFLTGFEKPISGLYGDGNSADFIAKIISTFQFNKEQE